MTVLYFEKLQLKNIQFLIYITALFVAGFGEAKYYFLEYDSLEIQAVAPSREFVVKFISKWKNSV